jgi:hypothetical protein
MKGCNAIDKRRAAQRQTRSSLTRISDSQVLERERGRELVELYPDAIRVFNVGSPGIIGLELENHVVSKAFGFVKGRVEVFDPEGQVIQAFAYDVFGVVGAVRLVIVQFEDEGAPLTLEVHDFALRLLHPKSVDDRHVEESGIKRNGVRQVLDANSNVLEASLHFPSHRGG